MKKRRTPRKNLPRFNVKGPVPELNYEIDLWTSAANEGQALIHIRERFKKKYNISVFLGNCTVTREQKIMRVT